MAVNRKPARSDFTAGAGAAAIGARLRRLSEQFDRETGRIYAELDVPFEQRWFGVVNLLSLEGSLSVGELATSLGVSHASISQIRKALDEAGLIIWEGDPNDGRRRKLALSAAGAAIERRLRPLWDVLDEAAIEINNEAGDTVAALERLEKVLSRQPLYDRVRSRLPE